MELFRIREARKAAKMTQIELAKLIGVTHATLSRYESGAIDPPSSQLQAIADALGVDVGKLLPTIPASMSAQEKLQADVKASKQGKTETYQPWTQADEMILRAGGFQAVAEFNFLSEADKAEALKDINKFIEFTLSKYKQQDAPPSPPGGTDTPAEKPTEGPPEGE